MITKRRGVTLIELLIAITLLAVVAAVGVVGSAHHRGSYTTARAIQDARGEAIRGGKEVLIQVLVGDSVYRVTAEPDGSVLADSILRVDRTSGTRSRDIKE